MPYQGRRPAHAGPGGSRRRTTPRPVRTAIPPAGSSSRWAREDHAAGCRPGPVAGGPEDVLFLLAADHGQCPEVSSPSPTPGRSSAVPASAGPVFGNRCRDRGGGQPGSVPEQGVARAAARAIACITRVERSGTCMGRPLRALRLGRSSSPSSPSIARRSGRVGHGSSMGAPGSSMRRRGVGTTGEAVRGVLAQGRRSHPRRRREQHRGWYSGRTVQVVVAELGEGAVPAEGGAGRHGPGEAAQRVEVGPAALVPPVALQLLGGCTPGCRRPCGLVRHVAPRAPVRAEVGQAQASVRAVLG